MRQANILDPIHDSLPYEVWEDPTAPEPKLRPRHEHFITRHLYRVLERGGYTDPHRWLSLYLTGSLCTYQYAPTSDCDVSLFVDATLLPEWSRAEMIGLMISGCEGVTLPGTPYELQGYVVAKGLHPTDLFKPGLRAGYSINDHRWINPPDRNLAHDVETQENGFYAWALMQADKMERLLRYEPDKAVQFWHQIHKRRMRDQAADKGDHSEANILYKFLFKRGLTPQIAQVSGEHIAAWTGPGDVSLTTQPSQNPMQEGPSPFANVQDWEINTGNSNNIPNHGEHLQEWMLQNYPDVPFRVQKGLGGWAGEPETMGALHLYATPHSKLKEILEHYGADHPEEEALAVIPQGHESYLWMNPSAGRAEVS